MRQITDPRAPFATIEEAIDIGDAYLRQLGWFPVAIVPEEQPGGYYVRIAGSIPIAKGGRAGRKRFQHETAEIGKIAGDWLVPLNETTLSGKSYFICEDGFGGEFEPVGIAQARLVKAHQERRGRGQ